MKEKMKEIMDTIKGMDDKKKAEILALSGASILSMYFGYKIGYKHASERLNKGLTVIIENDPDLQKAFIESYCDIMTN